MKKRVLLFLAVIGLALIVNSCQQDSDLPDDPKTGHENWQEGVARAKAFFEMVYSPDLKTRTALHSPAVAALSSMEVDPDWDRSLYSETRSAVYLEFPLLSEYQFKAELGHLENSADQRLMQRRLVIREAGKPASRRCTPRFGFRTTK